jgi:hypothetical protein
MNDLRIAHASHALFFDSFAAFCEAAPRVKCKRALAVLMYDQLFVCFLEVLLSLLFALVVRHRASAQLGGAKERRR